MQYRGINLSRKMHPVRVGIIIEERLQWVVLDPSGQPWGFKTRKAAEDAVDGWIDQFVGFPQTDMKGDFYKWVITDGAFTTVDITRQEWVAYWNEVK